MSQAGFVRKTIPGPTVDEASETVPDVEQVSRPAPQTPPTWVWVLVLVVGMVVLVVMVYRTGGRMFSFFLFPVMLMSLFMMLRGRGGGDKDARPSAVNRRRAEYLRKLDKLRKIVHRSAKAQAVEIAYHHPTPSNGVLASLVGTARMWERSPQHRNWGHVRMGVGLTRLKMQLNPPMKVPPPEFRESVTTVAARDFLLAQMVVHDVGRPLHLFDQMGWCFFNTPEQRPLVQGLLRAMVCQLAVFHGPDHVQIAVVTDDLDSWQWVKWLPHNADDEFVDACGPARLVFGSVEAFMERFEEQLKSHGKWQPMVEGAGPGPERWLVVVVDLPGASCAPIVSRGGHLGVSVLEATGDERSALATSATAYVVDEIGNLLKASKVVS